MYEPRRLPFLFFVTIAAALVGMVLYPLWEPLFLGAVLATALWRPHEALTRWLHHRRGLAATVLTIAAILLLLGPIASVVVIAARQAIDTIISLRQILTTDDLNELLGRLPRPLSDLIERVRDLLPPIDPSQLTGDLSRKLVQGSQWAVDLAGGALRITSQLAFELGIMLVTMHVVLVDGRALVAWLIEVSPLPRADTQTLLVEFRKATRAILTSTLATAGAQSLVSMLGYVIAGAPRPVFFGLVTFLCAFIPEVGTALVAVPMAVWLFITGHHAAAIFLGIYFLLVVSMVDNLLKPMLMKSGMRMHGAVVFLSLIGGVLSFGPIGLVVGPLALTFFLAMIRLREPHPPP
jgi:predicted PurR-regulated permease PerM